MLTTGTLCQCKSWAHPAGCSPQSSVWEGCLSVVGAELSEAVAFCQVDIITLWLNWLHFSILPAPSQMNCCTNFHARPWLTCQGLPLYMWRIGCPWPCPSLTSCSCKVCWVLAASSAPSSFLDAGSPHACCDHMQNMSAQELITLSVLLVHNIIYALHI